MWRAEDLGGLELLRATFSEFAFRPHAHEEFFIALTEKGIVTPTYRGDTHVIGPGDLIVLNPEEAHAGGPPAEVSWTYRALYPRPELMRRIMAELPGDRPAMPEFGGDVLRDQPAVAGCSAAQRSRRPPSIRRPELRQAHPAVKIPQRAGRSAVPARAARHALRAVPAPGRCRGAPSSAHRDRRRGTRCPQWSGTARP